MTMFWTHALTHNQMLQNEKVKNAKQGGEKLRIRELLDLEDL